MKIRNLALVLTAALWLICGVARADLNDGLVAHWPFNSNANDEGGNGSHGIIHGAILTTDRFGNPDSAYSFDGINDYIAASANGLPTASRTISLWFYANTLSPPGHLLAYGGSSGCGTSWLMEINNNDLSPKGFEVQSHCRVNRLAYFYATEPLGCWYHWVVTTDETGTKMYINGIEMASNDNWINNTIVNSTTQIAFGTGVTTSGIAPYQDSNAGYFNGKIDDIRIYNRALSEVEIQLLFDDRIADSDCDGVPDVQDICPGSDDNVDVDLDGIPDGCDACIDLSGNLVAYYPFNGNANDESGNENHGTVHGATLTTDRFGIPDSAYSFDGSDYVNFSATNMPSTDRTVGFWVNTSDTSARRLMFGYGGNYNSPQYSSFTIYFVSADKRSIEVHRHYPGGNFINYTAPSPLTNAWYHLSVTSDSSGSRLYINGEPVISNGTVIVTYVNGKDGYIGAIPDGGGISPYFDGNYPFFKGVIDDVVIYNRALSHGEISSLYLAGQVGSCQTPSLTIAQGEISVDEGQQATNSGTVSDPDDDYVTLTASIGSVIDHGDNTWSWVFDTTDGPAESQTVNITADDGSGGIVMETFELIVNNVAPVIDAVTIPIDPVLIGTSISATSNFSDPAGESDEPYTCTVNYGDGSEDEPGTVSNFECTGPTHVYTSPGVYTVLVTVTDKDGDSASGSSNGYIVVYDTKGGFVTGGGWIVSPAGAYAADPSLTGKANFGFVSKYKKGATTPTGETEFQYKVADLNFHSDSYDWLVIAGHKANYKGTGTINGTGNYGFMLSAIDEKLTPSTDVDLFRIKIWDKDNSDVVVYDNQIGKEDDADPTTAIGGGSIVIHKNK
ncbi:LamG-like jellyroll fold domain-containing protein [Thermodesulfobacteriota bacterium]